MGENITIKKEEYEQLLKYKEKYLESVSISNKKGKAYEKYKDQCAFLEYIKDSDPYLYKDFRTGYLKIKALNNL